MGELPISGTLTIRKFLGASEGGKLPYYDGGVTNFIDLLAERKYCVPGYQRGISWNKANAQILLKDLKESKKFLGNILLSYKTIDEFDIIDGQQRLTVIIMILECLKKYLSAGDIIKYCTFENESFPMFQELINKDFNLIPEDEDDLREKDILKQYDTMNELWHTVDEFIGNIGSDEKLELLENLLDSGVTVLFAKVVDGDYSSRRVCVDYFIDINNKSVELDHVEILKAYAFRESFEIISKQWIEINRLLMKLQSKDVTYPMDALFLHYLLCTINNYYELKSGLSDEYKLLDDEIIGDTQTYYKGTDIEILIKDKKYYKNMFLRLISYLNFLDEIIESKTSPDEKICAYFKAIDKDIDYDTKFNLFSIISGIVKNSDVVPKMLLLKYFLEVLNNENRTAEEVKSLYWINVDAVCFSASRTSSKGTRAFSPIVLDKNFIERSKAEAIKNLERFPSMIGFDKEVKHGKKFSTTSGQMLSRRLNILFNAYYDSNANISLNEKEFKYFSNTQGEYNDEHFIINESGGYSFDYNNKKQITIRPNIEYGYVSYLCNYLKIKKTVNDELKNKMIKDKIRIIQTYIDNNEKVFANKFSELLFYIAKEIFNNSNCPLEEDLKKCKTSEEAEIIAKEYFEYDFVADFEKYVSKVKDVAYVVGTLRRKKIDKYYLKVVEKDDLYEYIIHTPVKYCIGQIPCPEIPIYRVMAPNKEWWSEISNKLIDDSLSYNDIEGTECELLFNVIKEDASTCDLNEMIIINKSSTNIAAYAIIDFNDKKIHIVDSQLIAIEKFLDIYTTQSQEWMSMTRKMISEHFKDYRLLKELKVVSINEAK